MPPRFTDLAESLPASVPFVGPETQERQMGKPFNTRIGANECVFGPSPKALEAMCEAAAKAWMYCDPEIYDLRHALAAHHGVAAENIVVGEGIDGLLGLTCRLFLSDGIPVVTSAGAYPTFNFHVTGFGGALHTVPYKDDCEDPDALLKAAAETGARLIYIVNPDNPMGTVQDAATMQHMIDRVPNDALLCLDEAYIEFAETGTAPAIDTTNPNIIRFRTFSKAYGMAGARIGYAIAEANPRHRVQQGSQSLWYQPYFSGGGPRRIKRSGVSGKHPKESHRCSCKNFSHRYRQWIAAASIANKFRDHRLRERGRLRATCSGKFH